MNKLEEFISNYNLCTTNTCKNIYEFVDRLRDEDYSVDLSDSITLREFVDTFASNYRVFKQDYDKLTKLDLSQNMNIQRFTGNNERNFKCLELYLYNLKEMVNGHSCINLLLASDNDGKRAIYYESLLDRTKANIDESIIDEYIAFGEKYNDFIEAYWNLRNGMIYGNGTVTMFSSVYETKEIDGSIHQIQKCIHEIEKFNIALGTLFFDKETFIEMDFDINDADNITVLKSCIDNENTALNPSDVSYILDNTYISENYLPDLFKKEKNKTLERRK